MSNGATLGISATIVADIGFTIRSMRRIQNAEALKASILSTSNAGTEANTGNCIAVSTSGRITSGRCDNFRRGYYSRGNDNVGDDIMNVGNSGSEIRE